MNNIQPTVRWEKYLLGISNNYLDYLSKYGKPFLQELSINIIKAHRLRQPSTTLFTFRKSNIICTAQYHEYDYILKTLMSLCENLEFYEICAQILRHSKRFHKKKVIKT